ncbi:MAG: trypsin-like peptidase domain-containing protein [Candidatus Jettenia caeni]|nr:MAG: trypsin-like peptidase domain-containing protein [Candidatus Jettenia caeni]
MKAIFVHLSGSRRGNTELFASHKISIGTDTSNDLCFDPILDENTSKHHAEILLSNCDYVLKDKGSAKGTLVNNRVVTEITLKDGDLIEFGAGGPKVRFRIKAGKADVHKPWAEILEDSLGIAQTSQKRGHISATIFLKQLLWESFTQSSHTFKIYLFTILFIIVGSLALYLHGQYVKLSKTTERVSVLELERSVAENILKNYSGGVCFIQGSFYFYDEETNEPVMTMRMEGMKGFNEYTGTGFLVSKDGLILTNRHIAEPWWALKMIPYIHIEPNLKPRFDVFKAFFPGIKEPFDLKTEKISDDVDIALLRIDMRGEKIPTLELDYTGKGAVIGEPMLLLGYPAGVGAIFAKTDPEIVNQFAHLPFIPLVQELSNWGLIRPLSTHGQLSDIMYNRMVYDAETTSGGSGGPIFNNKGKVIGINYATFPGFRGSNFGVPISYGIELIEQVSHR